MVMSMTSVALENAAIPPLVAVLTLVPAVPLVWSQARIVSAEVELPSKLAAGAKYRRVLASSASSSDEAELTAPTAVQFVPPSVV